MKLTNEHNIHLSMSVFLASDNYDYDQRTNHISATGLLKSTRQIILSARSEAKQTQADIGDFVPSGLGNAVHDAIEAAWLNNPQKALRKLGYSENLIGRIRVNPEPSELSDDDIPIYVEQRKEKEIDGYVVSGKFDFVGDGELTDHKTTGVFSYMNKTNDENYKLQGSIYRWLNPDIITEDHMIINYFFTDWSKLRSIIEAKKGYPEFRSLAYKVPLMSIKETEQFIRTKLAEVSSFFKVEEIGLPQCTQEELWQGETTYKYYKNPLKKAKSTKNFNNYAEAQTRFIADGSIGEVVTVPAKAKRCNYCSGLSICSQAKQLIEVGLLDVEV